LRLVARTQGSWLDGPTSASAQGQREYAGQRLGLPPSGPGSVAGFGRRLGALVVDWLICSIIGAAVTGHRLFHPGGNAFVTPGIFSLEYVVLVSLIGCTIGGRLFGFRIVSLNGRRLDVGRVALRTLLLLLVIPAVVFDRDQRGLHDKAADSVTVRL
jgi:uncharacterized RDD family membrane protein YckC